MVSCELAGGLGNYMFQIAVLMQKEQHLVRQEL